MRMCMRMYAYAYAHAHVCVCVRMRTFVCVCVFPSILNATILHYSVCFGRIGQEGRGAGGGVTHMRFYFSRDGMAAACGRKRRWPVASVCRDNSLRYFCVAFELLGHNTLCNPFIHALVGSTIQVPCATGSVSVLTHTQKYASSSRIDWCVSVCVCGLGDFLFQGKRCAHWVLVTHCSSFAVLVLLFSCICVVSRPFLFCFGCGVLLHNRVTCSFRGTAVH